MDTGQRRSGMPPVVPGSPASQEAPPAQGAPTASLEPLDEAARGVAPPRALAGLPTSVPAGADASACLFLGMPAELIDAIGALLPGPALLRLASTSRQLHGQTLAPRRRSVQLARQAGQARARADFPALLERIAALPHGQFQLEPMQRLIERIASLPAHERLAALFHVLEAIEALPPACHGALLEQLPNAIQDLPSADEGIAFERVFAVVAALPPQSLAAPLGAIAVWAGSAPPHAKPALFEKFMTLLASVPRDQRVKALAWYGHLLERVPPHQRTARFDVLFKAIQELAFAHQAPCLVQLSVPTVWLPKTDRGRVFDSLVRAIESLPLEGQVHLMLRLLRLLPLLPGERPRRLRTLLAMLHGLPPAWRADPTNSLGEVIARLPVAERAPAVRDAIAVGEDLPPRARVAQLQGLATTLITPLTGLAETDLAGGFDAILEAARSLTSPASVEVLTVLGIRIRALPAPEWDRAMNLLLDAIEDIPAGARAAPLDACATLIHSLPPGPRREIEQRFEALRQSG